MPKRCGTVSGMCLNHAKASQLPRKSSAAAAHCSHLLLLATCIAVCIACGGKQTPSAPSACMADAADDLSRFVGTWACKDTITSCADYSTPPCSTKTSLDFVTFTANTDDGTLSMISTTLTCDVESTGSTDECIDRYCAAAGSAVMTERQGGNGTPADGTFIISGDNASFSRTERIKSNVTISLSGACTRSLDSGMLDAGEGSVGSDCDSSSARYSIERAEYENESAGVDTSCSAGAADCRASECCFTPTAGGDSYPTLGLCVLR